MSHPISQALASLANQISTTALNADPQTQARLQSLDGRCIEIQCTNPALTGCMHIVGGKVEFSDRACATPNVIVTGNLAELAGWMIQLTPSKHPSIRIDGDESTLQAFTAVVRQLKPDLQIPLRDWIGEDPAARLVASAELGISGIRSLLQGVGKELENRFRHTSQSNFTVNEEADEFNARVDALRLRVDRFSARLTMAEQARCRPGEST